jgi:hypothetical protein
MNRRSHQRPEDELDLYLYLQQTQAIHINEIWITRKHLMQRWKAQHEKAQKDTLTTFFVNGRNHKANT